MTNKPPKWTGVLIGKMHNENISINEFSKALAMERPYVSLILHGKRTPPNCKEKFFSTFEKIVSSRNES